MTLTVVFQLPVYTKVDNHSEFWQGDGALGNVSCQDHVSSTKGRGLECFFLVLKGHLGVHNEHGEVVSEVPGFKFSGKHVVVGGNLRYSW